MAQTLREQFRKSAGNVLSVDFKDAVSGQGFITFYLALLKDSTGQDYALTTNSSVYANNTNVQVTSATEYDFDSSPFNETAIISGTAVCNIYCNWNTAGTAGSVKWKIDIRKWDGATETDIADVTTETTAIAASSSGNIFHGCRVDIPKTIIKKGEQLRITLTPTITGGTSAVYIYGDPADRGGIPSNSNVNIPFDIDA